MVVDTWCAQGAPGSFWWGCAFLTLDCRAGSVSRKPHMRRAGQAMTWSTPLRGMCQVHTPAALRVDDLLRVALGIGSMSGRHTSEATIPLGRTMIMRCYIVDAEHIHVLVEAATGPLTYGRGELALSAPGFYRLDREG